MVGGSRSDDDMIKYFHVERPANLIELAGDRDILIARARVAARMIVDENDRSGIEFERAPEDCPGIDRKLRKGSVLELLVTDRKSVVKGKSVSVRVDLGGRRSIKKKKKK